MSDIEKIDQSIERLETIIVGDNIDIDAEKTYITELADELNVTIDTDLDVPILKKFIEVVEKTVMTKDDAEYIKLFSDKAFIDGVALIKVALPDFEKEKTDAVAADKKKLEDSVTNAVTSVLAQLKTIKTANIKAGASIGNLQANSVVYQTYVKKNYAEIMDKVKMLAKYNPGFLKTIEDKDNMQNMCEVTLTGTVQATSKPSVLVTFKDLPGKIDEMALAMTQLGSGGPFVTKTVLYPIVVGYKKLRILFKKVTDEITAQAKTIIDDAYKKIQTGGGLPELFALMIRTAHLLILKKNAEKLKTEQIKRRAATIAAAAAAQSATKPKPKPPSNTNDYLEPLMSLIMYKVGILNNYDKDFFAYCQKLGLDTGTTLAIFFTDKRKDCQDILKNILPYNLTAIMNVMRLKKLSAEQKFRQNYHIADDLHMRVLMEKQTIWG